MKKFFFLAAFLLFITLFLAAKYFGNLSVDSRKSDEVLAQIPADAAVVLEFVEDKSFYEIFREYPLFEYLIGAGQQEKLEQLKASLQDNPELAELIDQQKIYIALHHEEDSVNLLFTSSLKRNPTEATLGSLTDRTGGNGNQGIVSMKLNNNAGTFYFLMRGTVLAGSFSRELLAKVTDPKVKKISQNFIAEINAGTAGNRNSILNLFVNYEALPPFLSKFYREKLSGNYSLLNNLAGFSTLNMNFKSDALMFNGITNIDTTRQGYLQIFLNQEAAKGTLMRYLPQSAANSIQFNLSNYQQFEKDLRQLFQSRKEAESLSREISRMASETGINPERDIRNNWASEFSTFQTANHERFGIIRVKDGRKLGFLLEPLSGEGSGGIRKLNYSNLFYYYFGDPFRSFKRPYYFITDNLIFFSNSLSGLRNYISDYEQEHFLYQTPRYRAFEQLVSNQSSISLFIHNSNSKSITRTSLKKKYASNFSREGSGLKNIYGLSYQWTSDDGHFFTNLYIGTVQEAKEPAAIPDSLLNVLSSAE